MPASIGQRWTFTQASPLGDVSSSYELTAEGLRFRSDAPMASGSEMLRWCDIAEAATAVVDLPAHKGGPDLARWIPGRLEWLLVSRSGSTDRAFMRPLPAGEDREAIVAGLRERLGGRWVGEHLPLQAAQQRFRVSTCGDTLKVTGLVLATLGVLFAMLVLVVVGAALLWLPAGFLLGAWCLRRGVEGLRGAAQMKNTATAEVCGAALGPVRLEGRAVTDRPSPAGVSGQASVWWDVTIDAWYDGDDDGGWKQVMARHGGRADVLMLEDASGRVPVWLRDADLLLQQRTWETGRQPLPERGLALLEGTAFAWNGGKRLRVRETRLEANAPVYVLGTLDEARNLPADEAKRGVAGALRTGTWRQAVLRSLPALARAPVGIAFAYVDMLFSIGRGGERAQQPQDAPAPILKPGDRLVWNGRAGHALIVSDQRPNEALAPLRKRALLFVAIGAGVIGYCLYETMTLL